MGSQSRTRRHLATFGAAILAACATPPEPPPPRVDLAPFVALDAADFPGASSLLTGFAPPDDGPMRIGDAALLAVALHRGAAVERQLLRLEVVDFPRIQSTRGLGMVRPYQAFTITWTSQPDANGKSETATRQWNVRPITMRLSRHDAMGHQLRTSEARLFEEAMAAGWWPYTHEGAPQRDRDLAFALTLSLQELATNDPLLQDLLFRVVDKPNLWSLATNLGVHVTLGWQAPEPAPTKVDAPWFDGVVHRARCEMKLQGAVASWLDMLVTKPRGALAASAGLVGAIARHPHEADRYAVVRLLATKRGPAPGS